MPDDDSEDGGDERSARQIAKADARDAGTRSAKLASALMKVAESALKRLELDDDLREKIDRARAVTSPIARRRAERALGGDLRRVDLADIESRLANVQQTGVVDAKRFHLAEQWRTRMIEGGLDAAAAFPGGTADPLPELILRARRERDTGKPPGAARALFRHIVASLAAATRPPA
jgi:ribosomal 50S subunit-associated protein YjgA (DUF615 family)|nr:ribosome biogenesis factor YjgA [Kofleriaceae bacterium]